MAIFPDFSKMAIFQYFKMVAAAILEFRHFCNGRNSQEGQTASSHKISGRSVNSGDMEIFRF